MDKHLTVYVPVSPGGDFSAARRSVSELPYCTAIYDNGMPEIPEWVSDLGLGEVDSIILAKYARIVKRLPSDGHILFLDQDILVHRPTIKAFTQNDVNVFPVFRGYGFDLQLKGRYFADLKVSQLTSDLPDVETFCRSMFSCRTSIAADIFRPGSLEKADEMFELPWLIMQYFVRKGINPILNHRTRGREVTLNKYHGQAH